MPEVLPREVELAAEIDAELVELSEQESSIDEAAERARQLIARRLADQRTAAVAHLRRLAGFRNGVVKEALFAAAGEIGQGVHMKPGLPPSPLSRAEKRLRSKEKVANG